MYAFALTLFQLELLNHKIYDGITFLGYLVVARDTA